MKREELDDTQWIGITDKKYELDFRVAPPKPKFQRVLRQRPRRSALAPSGLVLETLGQPPA